MGKLRVLLVDDEVDILEMFGTRIESWGYEVIKAENGKKAMKILEDKKPDIIVLDYMMPGENGIVVLEKIRKTNKEIPVIMFTAHPDEKSMEGSSNLGAMAFVPKLSMYSDTQASLKSAIHMAEEKLRKNGKE